MERDKKTSGSRLFFATAVIIIIGTLGTAGLGRIKNTAADVLLSDCVMALLLLAVTCFHYRREYRENALDYDNGEHPYRFLLCLGIGLAVAFVCCFLPAGGWPFLIVFCMLSLFSNMGTGILAASSLLVIPVLLGGNGVSAFVLYFVCGCFSVTLFRHLERDFKIGIPVLLSVSCLLVCETANVVLTANAKPEFELFVIPASNMVISLILLLGALKLFSGMVVYRYRGVYLDMNDTEAPALVQFRERDRKTYMHCVHTTYFCGRIAAKLEMDVEALKCAGYYYRLEELPQLMEGSGFPPAARDILQDFAAARQGIRKRETAVLLCSDAIVSAVSYLLEHGGAKQPDYDRVISTVFQKLLEEGTFDGCDLSMRELKQMIKIFREEKLYYDFLR